LAKGCEFWGCGQAQRRWPLALEHWHRCTKIASYTVGTKRKLKSAAAGGDHRVLTCFHHFSESDAPGERQSAPIYDQGLGHLTGAIRAGRNGYRRNRLTRGRSRRSPTRKCNGHHSRRRLKANQEPKVPRVADGLMPPGVSPTPVERRHDILKNHGPVQKEDAESKAKAPPDLLDFETRWALTTMTINRSSNGPRNSRGLLRRLEHRPLIFRMGREWDPQKWPESRSGRELWVANLAIVSQKVQRCITKTPSADSPSHDRVSEQPAEWHRS
jgi:hypothetical protein